MNTLRLFMIFTFLAFTMSSTQAMAADPGSTAGGAVAGGAAGAVVGGPVGAGAGALLGGAAGAAAGDELEDRDADRFDADRDLSDSDVAQGFGSGPNISSEITPYDRSIDLDD